MLAGRKLLLADDSITIQKVVDLTFADEGVSVLCVSTGREAIERLEEFAPDVVLADVFMPEMNGYQVCEYIKQNDKLKHIPVMLLVGSFEPFDEEEARRVGANDTLTKPFQSIRRLIEKVGLLSSNRPSEEQIPTAELPKPEEPPVEKLSTAELEITTADTRPLPPELRHVVEEAAASQTRREQSELPPEAKASNEVMESGITSTGTDSQRNEGTGEVLLDLGDIRQSRSVLDDDFVLDIDLDEIPEPSPVEAAFSASPFRSPDNHASLAKTQPSYVGINASPATFPSEPSTVTTDQMATTLGFERIVDESVEESSPEPTLRVPEVPGKSAREAAAAFAAEDSPAAAVPPTDVSLRQLSPEMIEVIARRAVEHLSEKVVQEIAWEVVPQLAELLIKKQLEEKSS